MTDITTITYTIPEFLLPALINGDTSGLEDDEMLALDRLEDSARECLESHNARSCHWSPNDEYGSFALDHDAVGILACDCVEVDLVLVGAEEEQCNRL